MTHRKTFWFAVARTVDQLPIPGQCQHVYPNGRSRCGQRASDRHGEGKWCWSHRKVEPDGTRRAGPRDPKRRRTMDQDKAREINRKVRHKKDERVLRHLTDAAQAITPCPDNGSVFHPYTDLASEFRAEHKRWPVWWEMAKKIYEYETSD